MTPQSEKNDVLTKEIENGFFRNHYLIYNRKSTDELENQKNSIRYQKSENVRFAFRQGLSVANITVEGFCTDGIISEKHSAFKENTELIIENNGLVQFHIERPKFYKLIQFLNKGYFKGVVILCWDRISRNKSDEAVIRKLIKAGIDFRFVLATYDNTSSGALHMDIDGMFAAHHSRVTSEKVTLTIKLQRERGICTYKAPVGYLNLGRMDHKPFDQTRAPIIKQLFELYASGNWTLKDLARWAIEQGFTMPPFRRRKTLEEKLAEEDDDISQAIEPITRIPTYTGMQKILTNPFYTGKVLGNNGMYVQSKSHQALISQDLFDKVQIALHKRKISNHYIERLDYPFRGLIRCAECGRVYTPYMKKNNVYFGSHCTPNCSNTFKSFNLDFILLSVSEKLNKFNFSQEELEELIVRESIQIANLEFNRINKLENNEGLKKRLREDLAYLRANKLILLKTGVYSPTEYLEEEVNLTKQIENLVQEESISDEAMNRTVKEFYDLSELLKTMYQKYIFGNRPEKEGIVTLLFSELTIYQKDLQLKCNPKFKCLEPRLVLSCDPTGWLSELLSRHAELTACINTLQEFFSTYKAG